MGSKLRLIAVNVAVLLAMVVLLEAVLGSWTGPVPRESGFTCFDRVLHHRYCGGIAHRNRMSAVDGGKVIMTYTDSVGASVAPDRVGQPSAISNADVVLIGDSFMQADEMAWPDRMGQLLARDLSRNVVTIGYSSWAPATQTNWLIQAPLKAGVHVAYFLMTNDLTPSYPNSNLRYHAEVPDQDFPLEFQPQRADEPREAAELSFIDQLMARSFTLSAARAAWAATATPAATAPAAVRLLSRRLAAPQTCAAAEAAADSLPPETWLLDYVLLSLPARCWPQPMLQGVDGAVADIALAYRHIAQIGGTMHVYLIPAGWAFDGENLVGKASLPWFGLEADATIGQSGVAIYMERALAQLDVPFTDLEPVIKKLKQDEPGQFYFPADGHWTPLAHRMLTPLVIRDSGLTAP